MTEPITARSLLVDDFEQLDEEQPLSVVRRALCDLAAQPQRPAAVVIVGPAGDYRGLLTARLLLRSMLSLWEPGSAVRHDPLRLDEQVLEVVRGRSRVRAGDALIQGLPSVGPAARLLPLIEAACEAELEYVPVVADHKPVGLVPVTRIFSATAGLVLTPGDEGIVSR